MRARLAKVRRFCSRLSRGIRSYMNRLPMLLTLLVVAACTREPYRVCFGPSEDNCRNFRSVQHFEAWDAAKQKELKEAAARFPDDFRDIVAVVLKDFLKTNESPFEDVKNQYFATVFNDDIDQATQSKLSALGVVIAPGSKYVERDKELQPPSVPGAYLMNYEIYVSSIQRLGDGAYEVEFGYSCGLLCAGHFRYRLKRDARRWVIISRDALWYS